MSQCVDASDFLPPERTSLVTIQAQREDLLGWTPLREMLESAAVPLAILNERRQLIYGNPVYRSTVETLPNEQKAQDPTGKRPGEIWGCVQAEYSPAGCGTSFVCRNCRVANALVDALKWGQGEGHTVIRRQHMASLGVDVHVAAFSCGSEMWLLCRFGDEPYRPPPDAVNLTTVDPPAVAMDLYHLLLGCEQL